MIAGLVTYPRYRESKAAWLAQIPEHWDELRTRYLVREVDNRSQRGEETHLSMSQKLGLVPASMLDQQTLVSASYAGGKLVQIDDLVLNRLKAHLGVFALARQPGVISPDYTVFRRARPCSVKYLEHVLRSPACRSELRTRAKGIVEGFWRLYTDDFYNIRLPVPPPDEQAAIVRFLDHVDRRIRRYIRARQELIKLLEEQKQAIIHQIVTRGLDPNVRMKSSGVEWLGEVPEHWEIRKIKFLTDTMGGMTPRKAEQRYWGGTVPWVSPKDMKVNRLGDSVDHITDAALNETSIRRVPAGSVLIVVRGMILARTFPVAVTTKPVTVNQDMKALLPCGINGDFLAHLLVGIQRHVLTLVEEAGHGTRCLRTDEWQNMRLPVPPQREQAAIVAHLNQVLNTGEEALLLAREQLGLMGEMRARIVADVVTGKLDVRAEAAALPDEPDDSGDLAVDDDVTEDGDVESTAEEAAE